MEEWKDIKGYEGLYQVSNKGRIRNTKNYILKPQISGKSPYQMISLFKDNKSKRFTIHRLVATHFIPNPRHLPIINHKDENKLNNNTENLEWCDYKYNLEYGNAKEKMIKKNQNHTRNKAVQCIETKEIYKSTREAERQTGIFHSEITKVCKGKRKSVHGLHWKYINNKEEKENGKISFK